ncbi:MAG: UDP-N-acetylglucosamine 4,6-dehydratase (inverting) [Chlamydiae bacterium]|nr:UDP-N-acetylglucosamine 4,6-dehydratase (inverting) [Chlamydiota bacterium]
MTTMAIFKDKKILITGGTGSFGRTFAKKLLTESECHKLIIFSRDEWKQWEMQNSDPVFSDPRVRYFLGDVRDESRLMRAFHEIDIIVHAAALKQVPAAEYNPSEFINTNVLGAMNIINAAINCGVKKVIALSTDKAVNPINLYGATKLCSDKLFIAGNAYVGARGYPIFSVVRYGNVLASRGSIIPLWRKQIAEGAKEVPVTDVRMTRFWITVDQAAEFVAKAFSLARGGEIFVPKIPSMKIIDLAKAIAPDMPITTVGIRAGEKLHELMIGEEDARHTLEFDDHYIIVPEIFMNRPPLLEKFLAGREGKAPPEGFAYTSDTNEQWLSVEELQQLVGSI